MPKACPSFCPPWAPGMGSDALRAIFLVFLSPGSQRLLARVPALLPEEEGRGFPGGRQAPWEVDYQILLFKGLFDRYLETDFPGGSDGKASVYNVGDLGSIPGSGRSPGGGMATHSTIFAWEIPWTEEPGGI